MTSSARWPLVSVIVPAYNHAKYIAVCLESIYADTYPEIELIVLDDGSKDETYIIAKRWAEFKAHRFRSVKIERQENQGIAKTLNTMISWANGDFIALLASDDMLITAGLQARVEALQKRPDWLAVFADCVVIDSEGSHVASSGLAYLGACIKRLLDEKSIARELILNWSMPGPVFMARREAYDRDVGVGPYDESLAYEDRYMYVRLLSRRAVGFLNKTVAGYRVHPHGFTTSPERRWLGLETMVRADRINAPAFDAINRFLLNVNAFHCSCLLNIWKGHYLVPVTLFPLWVASYILKRLLAPRRKQRRVETTLRTKPN